MVFSYDFPHFKTQEILYRLLTEGYKIRYVIASPWKKLNIPHSILRDRPYYTGLIHPQKICQRFNIPYKCFDHNSNEAIKYIKNLPVDYGIIASARILSKNIISLFDKGIINIHPGILPEIRGLETLKWSILLNQPIGNTVHLLGNKIDGGRLINKEVLKLNPDDSMIDISLRLFMIQPEILIKSLKVLHKLGKRKINTLEDLDLKSKNYYSSMPSNLEKKVLILFSKWLRKYSH